MMENSNPPTVDDLPEYLQRRLTTDRADLVTQYQRALRESLFTSRSEVRPAMLGRIASDEVDKLLAFFHPDPFHHPRDTV